MDVVTSIVVLMRVKEENEPKGMKVEGNKLRLLCDIPTRSTIV